MADWPERDELKQVLDITSQDWDETVDRVLAAAISQVKEDVGNWVEDDDQPDDALAQAALRLGELFGLRPETAASVGRSDPTYMRLLKGHHRRFGIA